MDVRVRLLHGRFVGDARDGLFAKSEGIYRRLLGALVVQREGADYGQSRCDYASQHSGQPAVDTAPVPRVRRGPDGVWESRLDCSDRGKPDHAQGGRSHSSQQTCPAGAGEIRERQAAQRPLRAPG